MTIIFKNYKNNDDIMYSYDAFFFKFSYFFIFIALPYVPG
jgi:hypothetical protein